MKHLAQYLIYSNMTQMLAINIVNNDHYSS